MVQPEQITDADDARDCWHLESEYSRDDDGRGRLDCECGWSRPCDD